MDYQINKPYPEISVIKPNERYGQMILDNIGGMNSEMSGITHYLYNQCILSEEFKELKETFLRLSLVEMHHLDIFMELALKLGMDPRLWSCQDDQCFYWSPAYINYPNCLTDIIHGAINDEYEAIKKYQLQSQMIDDCNIVAILERIIEDEQLHLNILKHWEAKLVR